MPPTINDKRQYNFFPASEQLAMIRPRLADAERQHYQLVLDVKNGVRLDGQVITDAEAKLDWLTAEHERLTAAVAAEESDPVPADG